MNLNPSYKHYLLYLLLGVFCLGCYSFNPKSAQSSMIILSAILEKDEPIINEFWDAKFDNVTLRKGDVSISYSEKSDHYFYFSNLTPGQYELGELIHLIQKGNGGNAFASTKSLSSIKPPLTREDRMLTYVNLEPGSVVFMGEVYVKADLKLKGDIEIKAKLNKDISAEKRAIDYFLKNFPRSGWAELLKERKKNLSTITIQ